MDTFWSTLVASAASLLGVWIGIVSSRGAIRAQDRRAALAARAEASDAVADELVSALKQLRRLPEPHSEEMASEVYLPRHWYEVIEPALLQRLGRLQDADVRVTLRLIITSVGDKSMHEPSSTYGYIERQLLLALEIVQASRRGEWVDAEYRAQLDDLRTRVKRVPPSDSSRRA